MYLLEKIFQTQEITNKEIKRLSGEEDMQKVKKAFQRLKGKGIIEPVDSNVKAFDYGWK